MSSPSTTPLISSHLARLTLAGFRPRTIESRQQVLEAFARTLEPRQPTDATRLDCEAWLSRPLAPESRRAYRSHLRAFYAWCVEEGFLSADPTDRIPAVRVKRGTPRPMSDADLTRALALADRRMRAWLLLMALAGLRCMEVAALRPCDLIDTEHGPILHLPETKGGGTAAMPAHTLVVEALRSLPVRNRLWWSVLPATLSAQVNRHLRASGATGSAHSLRHHAGTAFYDASGHDLLLTAQLLRHVSVSSTQIYAQLSPTRPAEVVGRVHLRAV